MINKLLSHSISPKRVLRGEKAWEEGKKLIPSICHNPILIGRSHTTKNIRDQIKIELNSNKINTISADLDYDCCEPDITRLQKIAIKSNCDGVIAAGGGKVLDAGKLLSDRLSIPCITIPTSAATCAGWTALSNIYTTKGAFVKDVILKGCPDLLIFDYSFVRQAPSRTLASGIGDALAKWYEASLTSSSSTDGLVQQAVQMARVLRDQLFIDGYEAFINPNSEAWIRVSEGCALTAGLIGGIGGSRCRTAGAHALHNGLTQLKFSEQFLHGEIVSFGILVQLSLEESIDQNQLANQAKKQLIQFLKKLNLPSSLDDLGLNNVSINDIELACKFACRNGSDIHRLPFGVDADILLKALTMTNSKTNVQSFTEIRRN